MKRLLFLICAIAVGGMLQASAARSAGLPTGNPALYKSVYRQRDYANAFKDWQSSANPGEAEAQDYPGRYFRLISDTSASGRPCGAVVGKWRWSVGGGVAVIKPDGTMVYEAANGLSPSGSSSKNVSSWLTGKTTGPSTGAVENQGTWKCTDPSRNQVTLRWQIGGFVNRMVLSADGQRLSSTDMSQSYVSGTRIAGTSAKTIANRAEETPGNEPAQQPTPVAPQPSAAKKPGPPTTNPAFREWVSRVFRTDPEFQGFRVRKAIVRTGTGAVSWIGPNVSGGIVPVKKGLFPGFDLNAPAASFIRAIQQSCLKTHGKFAADSTPTYLPIVGHGASSYFARVTARSGTCRTGRGNTHFEVDYFQPIENHGTLEPSKGYVVMANSADAAAVRKALQSFVSPILEAATPECKWQGHVLEEQDGVYTPNCRFLYREDAAARQAVVALSASRQTAATGHTTTTTSASGSGGNAGTATTQSETTANLTQLQRKADAGDANAMDRLGQIYLDRNDYRQALDWFGKSAAQGNADAQNAVGFMYAAGFGVPRDNGRALAWYRKAAAQGNATAQYNLGEMDLNGVGVRENDAQALVWFRKAATQGNAKAEDELGRLYFQGDGVRRDYGQALAWFRKAAARGNAAAQYNLGYMYWNGVGVQENDAQALAWFRKSAAQGNAQAENALGDMYSEGDGVRRDDGKALAWYRKAATQGNAEAQDNLGEMYEHGRSVRPDYGKALAWFRKSAAQSYFGAQYDLGYIYEHGLGVQQDFTRAVAWYRKAGARIPDAKIEADLLKNAGRTGLIQYGAIAIDRHGGAGLSSRASSLQQAKSAALNGCGHSDCSVAAAFGPNQCGVVSRSRYYLQPSIGPANLLREIEASSIEHCNQKTQRVHPGAERCVVAAYQCN